MDTQHTIITVQATQEIITIDYMVPYDGIAELRIFSGDTALAYIDQYKCYKGTNHIRIKPKKLPAGDHILYLGYKGHMLNQKFNVIK